MRSKPTTWYLILVACRASPRAPLDIFILLSRTGPSYDADAFTKEHLKRKFGKTDTELAAIPLPTEEKPAPKRFEYGAGTVGRSGGGREVGRLFLAIPNLRKRAALLRRRGTAG